MRKSKQQMTFEIMIAMISAGKTTLDDIIDKSESLTERFCNHFDIKEQVESNVSQEDIESIYKLYPSRCKVRDKSTGKSSSNKKKIRALLKKEYTKEKLSSIINRYVKECRQTDAWMKSFSTFLNNIPDYDSKKHPESQKSDKLKLLDKFISND